MAAISASAHEHYFMVSDAEARGQPIDKTRWTLSRHVVHPIARVALEVVVMGQPGKLVPARLSRQLDRTDKPALGEFLERAVNRGEVDCRRIVFGQRQNLGRAQRPLRRPERGLDRDAL
jgi:hypothetical protein